MCSRIRSDWPFVRWVMIILLFVYFSVSRVAALEHFSFSLLFSSNDCLRLDRSIVRVVWNTFGSTYGRRNGWLLRICVKILSPWLVIPQIVRSIASEYVVSSPIRNYIDYDHVALWIHSRRGSRMNEKRPRAPLSSFSSFELHELSLNSTRLIQSPRCDGGTPSHWPPSETGFGHTIMATRKTPVGKP